MKNPWMSLWLSAANQAAGAARGLWLAEAQRQQQAFARQMTRVWTASLTGSRSKPAAKRPQK
jgi:hypothetical protein